MPKGHRKKFFKLPASLPVMDGSKENIGRNLKAIREKAGLCQTTAAQKARRLNCRWDRHTISKHEAGKHMPVMKTLLAYAVVYGCNVSDFFKPHE